MSDFKCFLSATAQNGGHYLVRTSILQCDFNAQIEVFYFYFMGNQRKRSGQASQVVVNDEK